MSLSICSCALSELIGLGLVWLGRNDDDILLCDVMLVAGCLGDPFEL
jgi:hypothetical protein